MPFDELETDGGSWPEWRNLVLQNLAQSRKDHANLLNELSAIKVDLARLKVSASLWGLVAGSLPGILALIGILVAKVF